MKKRISKLSSLGLIIGILFIISSCNKDTTEQPINQNPTCSIKSPQNGQEIKQGEIITISVEANDSDGTIYEVQIYVDDIGVGSATNFPYNFEWNTANESITTHSIKATAVDNNGGKYSDVISISIIDEVIPENKWQLTTEGTIFLSIRMNDPDSTYLIFSTDKMYKINNRGEVIWAKPSPILLGLITDYEFINNNELVILSSSDYDPAYLCKINTDGETIWLKEFDNYSLISGLCLTDGGEILLTGQDEIPPNLGGIAIMLNNNGEEIWQKDYPQLHAALECIYHNDKFYIVGLEDDGNLITISNDGVLLDVKTFDNFHLFDIALTNDQNIILYGQNKMFKVDPTLNILWEKNIQETVISVLSLPYLRNSQDGFYISNPQWIKHIDINGSISDIRDVPHRTLSIPYDYGIMYSANSSNTLIKTGADFN